MKTIYFFISFCCFFFLQGQSQNAQTIINEFSSVKIGDQVWAAKNLDVANFKNGDAIPEAKTAKEWETYGAAGEAAWCYYENNSINGEKFGKLYNWYAVNDPRGIAPEGWHVPTDLEWSNLESFVGGASVAGMKLKSKKGWKNNENGTNSSGFDALPGGFRSSNGGFIKLGSNGYWWCAPADNSKLSWCRGLDFKSSGLGRQNNIKMGGFSVRVIKD